MSANQIVLYLFLLFPGILSVKLYRTICPEKKESDLYELANSVLQSIIIVALYIVIFKKEVSDLLSKTTFEIMDLGILLTISLVWSALLIVFKKVRLWLANRFQPLSFIKPQNYSVWERINTYTKNEWAIIYVNDGSIYRGYISQVNLEPDKDDFDFLLSEAVRVEDDLAEKYNVNGIGVYFRMANITRIEFIK